MTSKLPALFIFILFFCFYDASSQTHPDIISTKKIFGGYQFSQYGKTIKMGQLPDRVQTNSEAFELAKSAKSSFIFANVLGAVGGFMIGWPLGTAAGGGDPQWTMLGIGASIAAISIPLSISSNKKAINAIEKFNGDLEKNTDTALNKIEFNLTLKGNGIGLVMSF
ncbi:MAG: hypothetical protein JXR03_06345 [Cyclobacteriaceae bacterium]